MTTSTLSVSKYMSHGAFTIGRDQPLARAHMAMRDHHIRHLPVLQGGELIGMVSQSDLYLIETLHDVDPTRISVEEAMSREVYSVAPETPLVTVARTMAERKLGSAVVMEHGRVLGVFTAVDAARVLADFLEQQASHVAGASS